MPHQSNDLLYLTTYIFHVSHKLLMKLVLNSVWEICAYHYWPVWIFGCIDWLQSVLHIGSKINFFMYIINHCVNLVKFSMQGLWTLINLCKFKEYVPITKPALCKAINGLFNISQKPFHKLCCNYILALLGCWNMNFSCFVWHILYFA
jgi:hypothetical protein